MPSGRQPAGAPVEFRREGKLIVQGKVLEYDPPRRLSYMFQSMHEPFYGAEQPSRVVSALVTTFGDAAADRSLILGLVL